ncbi:unnamed protein product [Spirodela intermedia]|uniref:WAT1-related protein n=1 Tax=Spirodela intermedia TaxID=51605 RepID=A0A7I8I953_SPIIN|nr:unnamed protein product [Spirodela intermedia]CAA6653963.1 unnamed protein product [Spirodela intermedia]
MGSLFQRMKPYMAMIALQFGYAGMNIITKVSLNGGMSHYVLVVYRHAFATLSIAPFALILERKVRPKMTLSVFLQIFVLAMLGPVIDQNFYYAGLKFTSPTFSCAMSNILPAMTFVLAVICRMEKVDMKRMRCQAKVAGTVVTVAGAMLMTLYKGPIVDMVRSRPPTTRPPPLRRQLTTPTTRTGSRAFTLKRYSAQLSLTTLICFVGTLQAIVVTFVMEHKPSAWTIGFDMNLLAAAYAGIVTSSLAYYVQGLVINKRGPVFASAFSPLMMIIVAVMGSFILLSLHSTNPPSHLTINLLPSCFSVGCRILGAILIVAGLYSVLWGKYKENQEKEASPIPIAIKGMEGNGQGIEGEEMELKKAKTTDNNKETNSSLGALMNGTPMKTKEGTDV